MRPKDSVSTLKVRSRSSGSISWSNSHCTRNGSKGRQMGSMQTKMYTHMHLRMWIERIPTNAECDWRRKRLAYTTPCIVPATSTYVRTQVQWTSTELVWKRSLIPRGAQQKWWEVNIIQLNAYFRCHSINAIQFEVFHKTASVLALSMLDFRFILNCWAGICHDHNMWRRLNNRHVRI